MSSELGLKPFLNTENISTKMSVLTSFISARQNIAANKTMNLLLFPGELEETRADNPGGKQKRLVAR